MNSDSRWTRRTTLKSIIGSGAAVSGFGVGTSLGQSTENEQLYIVLAGGTGLRDELREKGFEVLHEIGGGSVVIANGSTERESELRSLAVVSDAVPNQTIVAEEVERKQNNVEPDSEQFSQKQWDKRLTNTFDAHEIATGAGTSLAIIGTGVDHSHPDLPSVDAERSRAIHRGQFESGRQSINVRTNPSEWLPSTQDVELPAGSDVDGHGTHVAGIAAASRDGGGITGVAPDANVVSLRTGAYQETGAGYSRLQITVADVLIAIDYAVEIGVDVANISLILGPLNEGIERRRYFAAFRRLVQHAIEQGTVVVVAAGNQDTNIEENPLYVLPSTNRGVINVTSTGPNDRRYYNSNFGEGIVDVAAPGGGYETREKTFYSDDVEWPAPANQIISTVPSRIFDQKYRYDLGTSMAAPQVAGLACLIRELKPGLHPRRVKQAIERNAVEVAGPDTTELGAGRISVLDTVKRLKR
ncbi:S8 family serine peptidase [Halobacteria archaeon HArc-gm2]|nr:S8 family serine peptidase [Halobacteria archaeon HArc-gm2]